MYANAIVFQQPKALALSALQRLEMGAGDVLVKVEYSGISTPVFGSYRRPPARPGVRPLACVSTEKMYGSAHFDAGLLGQVF